MTTLITGGTGFLGSYLARELASNGEHTVLFEYNPNFGKISWRGMDNEVELVRGDLSVMEEVFDVLKTYEVETVYHTGALLSSIAEENPQRAFRVNLDGTFNVLEGSRILGVKKVIFTSTIATFGSGIDDPVNDSAPQRPVTIYGVTKVSSERLGEYYYRKFGLNFRGIRFPSVIGAGRGPEGVSGYTTLMFEEPLKGRPYEAYVRAESITPIMYVKDAVKALISLGNADDKGLKRRVYNIAGISPTAGEIREEIRKFTEAEIRFKPVPAMQEIIDSWPSRVDDSCASSEWGWRVEYDLVRMIEDFASEIADLEI